MRNLYILVLLAMVTLACKNDKKAAASDPVTADDPERTAKQSDGLTLLKGDFIYYADAAVLQTHREVYGVVIDEKMHELNERVKAYQKDVTDMIPVEVRGKIIPKPENEEGWAFRVQIKEILNVSEPNPDDNQVIKLGTE